MASVKQVFAPALVGAAQHAHDLPAGVKRERPRLAAQFQARFFRQAVALAAVAGMAAGDKVVPVGVSASRPRNDVVKSQFRSGKDLVAELAGIAVADQDILAREGPRLMRNTTELSQADNGRYSESCACG